PGLCAIWGTIACHHENRHRASDRPAARGSHDRHACADHSLDGRHPGTEWILISPRVTVIIIFRDEERFLPEALDSVFAQAYDAWELLLVDDGSTDGSVTLARER